MFLIVRGIISDNYPLYLWLYNFILPKIFMLH